MDKQISDTKSSRKLSGSLAAAVAYSIVVIVIVWQLLFSDDKENQFAFVFCLDTLAISPIVSRYKYIRHLQL